MNVQIAGLTFEASPRYTEGHTLSANEAAALNQMMFENVGNNLRSRVKDRPNQESDDQLREEFNKYLSDYQFGVRSARSSAPSDPVGAEAHRLALEFIKGKIKAAGKKLNDYKTATLNEAARNLVNDDPAYHEQAEKNVAEAAVRAENQTEVDLRALGIGEPDAVKTPAPAPTGPAEGASWPEGVTTGEGASEGDVRGFQEPTSRKGKNRR